MTWVLFIVSVGLGPFGQSAPIQAVIPNYGSRAECARAAAAAIALSDGKIRVKATCLPRGPHKH